MDDKYITLILGLLCLFVGIGETDLIWLGVGSLFCILTMWIHIMDTLNVIETKIDKINDKGE